jgi:hypothetical protein
MVDVCALFFSNCCQMANILLHFLKKCAQMADVCALFFSNCCQMVNILLHFLKKRSQMDTINSIPKDKRIEEYPLY